MHRKMRLAVAATTLALVGVSLGSAGAGASIPIFKGGAPGSVTCTFTLTVTYTPKLVAADPGATTSEKIAGTGSSCVANSGTPGVTTTVTGTREPAFSVPPSEGIVPDSAFDCNATFGGGTIPLTVLPGWTFKWTGVNLTGTIGATTYPGSPYTKFNPTPVPGISAAVSGNQLTLSGTTQLGGGLAGPSFQGPVSAVLTLSNMTLSKVASLCAKSPPYGLGTLKFTGSLTVGS